MLITLQIFLGLVTLICLTGGMNLLRKGATFFLPAGTPPQQRLDNLFRFLSGIYFGLGFLMAWVVYDLKNFNELVYFIGLVVVCSGLGRLYSKMKLGSAGRYFEFIMVFEMLLGIIIILLQYLRQSGY